MTVGNRPADALTTLPDLRAPSRIPSGRDKPRRFRFTMARRAAIVPRPRSPSGATPENEDRHE